MTVEIKAKGNTDFMLIYKPPQTKGLLKGAHRYLVSDGGDMPELSSEEISICILAKSQIAKTQKLISSFYS